MTAGDVCTVARRVNLETYIAGTEVAMAEQAYSGNLKDDLSQPCFNQNYIDGQFAPVSTGDTYETISPTTERVVHHAPASGAEDVAAAIAAARRAADEGYEEWGGLEASVRVQYCPRPPGAVKWPQRFPM